MVHPQPPRFPRSPALRLAAWLGIGGGLLAPDPAHAQPADAAAPEDPASVPAEPAPASSEPLATRPPQLVRNRQVVLLADDPDVAAGGVAKLARELGGELGAQRPGYVEIRVPGERLSEAWQRLRKLGSVQPRAGGTQEVAWRRAELEAELRSAEAAAARMSTLLERAESIDDSLLVERSLANVNAEIARLRAALIALRRQSGLVTIGVRLKARETVSPETVPAVALPFPWLRQLGLGDLLDTSRRTPPEDDDYDEPIPGIESNLDMGVQLEARQLVDRPRAGTNRHAVTLAVRSRGVIDTEPVGWALGSEVALGGGEGFVYEAAFMVGLGASAGEVSSLGLIGGLGVSGWTGRGISESLELPVELFMTLEFGEYGRAILFAQPQWTPTTASRRGGAGSIPFGDELSLGGALLVPALVGSDELEEGGLRLGFVHTRLLGTQMYLVTAGIGLGLVQY